MSLETLLLFLPACFVLNLSMGPNNLMAMTHGARHGVRVALVATLGRLVAQALMIAVSAAGLAAVLFGSAIAFHAIKLVGAAYLLWLAWQLWHAPPDAAPAGQ